mmetsp:Transcript_23606/g.76778  ORF Transcript_23606/g.76778 Transcript_23606/m.76778 type:complete len:464 (-) Transcript_23606:43-1434(-)
MSQNVAGLELAFMAGEAVVYFALTLLIEHSPEVRKALRRAFFFCSRGSRNGAGVSDVGAGGAEDEDVVRERERVDAQYNMQAPMDALTVRGFRKVYGNGKVAVRSLSFGVAPGECFGLLGVNGAGKSTTFKFITGEITASVGDAHITSESQRWSVTEDTARVRQLLGYCPQFDALQPNMTAREALGFYAALRGIPAGPAAEHTRALLERMALAPIADRPCGGYSGGNRRKLSVALALIGDPPVVLLDEPSTGMDPEAKRFLWNVLRSTLAAPKDGERQCVVLTSHSMEECEALCGSVGIMTGGALRCFGSVPHLKYRFGQGYKLHLRAHTPAAVPELRSFVERVVPGATLIEAQPSVLDYALPRLEPAGTSAATTAADGGDASPTTPALAALFEELERAKAELALEDYALSQTSLEEVFVQLAGRSSLPAAATPAPAPGAPAPLSTHVIELAFRPEQAPNPHP